VSETTLSAEVEAALTLVGQCHQRAWRDGEWKWVALTPEASTLRTALTTNAERIERLERIEAAANAHLEAWDAMEEAVENRRTALYEADHGQFLSDSFKAELSTAIREANVVEHRTAGDLRATLEGSD